jgi:hypothetical protein
MSPFYVEGDKGLSSMNFEVHLQRVKQIHEEAY